MLSYEWDEGEPLSARGDDSTGQLTERRNHTLLRPIYINAVEVGYAYTQCDKDKRLNTVAMLPYCFKTYPDKSSSWPELMALFKMNLIEFTPGYGSEKYTEVNRILANRAADTGGCIVARSQMHNIIEERPTLDRTVEKRLLMPSFNHNDIIFPVDGPLGRCGPSLRVCLAHFSGHFIEKKKLDLAVHLGMPVVRPGLATLFSAANGTPRPTPLAYQALRSCARSRSSETISGLNRGPEW
ncbi:hypothetical protein ANCDUO_06596 [Ancylostoma duodenale]|uniref:RNase NYN domain-containing protein n=1 Tax=Ancylostoma duodenale TaxID=51022 RepID=A0A0C2DKM3_9BILA|nr:hypothetical protein ANCDUO_06596 [Ancylostoma duodenale]